MMVSAQQVAELSAKIDRLEALLLRSLGEVPVEVDVEIIPRRDSVRRAAAIEAQLACAHRRSERADKKGRGC